MLALLIALASDVTAVPIGADRFQVTVVYRGSSPFDQAEAQFKLADAAKRLCKGKGRAVSGGALQSGQVPKTDKAARKKGRFSLTEEWRCVPLPKGS